MQLSIIIAVGFLATGCLGGTKYDANLYIDTVLRNSLPNSVRSSRLDPFSLPEFEVKLPGHILKGEPKFKAKFKDGKLHGLATVPVRRGDCSAPGWQGANVTIGCYLSLDGLRANFTVSSKGDSFFDSKKRYIVDLLVTNTNAFVEVTQRLPTHPTVRAVTVNNIALNWFSSATLNLNDRRWKSLEGSVKGSVQAHILSVLRGPFTSALQRSLQNSNLPRP